MGPSVRTRQDLVWETVGRRAGLGPKEGKRSSSGGRASVLSGMTGQDAEGGYAFAQQPRAVSSGRGASAGGKYRDPNMADDRLAVSTLPTSLLLHARASAMPLAIQRLGEAGNHRGTCLVLLPAARFFPPCMSRSSRGGEEAVSATR
jgi:hypothetical protein